MPPSISSLFETCVQQLSGLISSDRLTAYENEVPVVLWQDELGRLRIWAKETHLSSLEDLLRDAFHTREQLFRISRRLQRALTDMQDVLNKDIANEATSDTDDADDTDTDEGDVHGTEMQMIHHSLRDTINCLNQITIVTLQPVHHPLASGKVVGLSGHALVEEASPEEPAPVEEPALTEESVPFGELAAAEQIPAEEPTPVEQEVAQEAPAATPIEETSSDIDDLELLEADWPARVPAIEAKRAPERRLDVRERSLDALERRLDVRERRLDALERRLKLLDSRMSLEHSKGSSEEVRRTLPGKKPERRNSSPDRRFKPLEQVGRRREQQLRQDEKPPLKTHSATPRISGKEAATAIPFKPMLPKNPYASAEEDGSDTFFLCHGGIMHKLQFPASSMGDAAVNIGQLREGAMEVTQAASRDSIKLFHKGKVLEDDSLPCRDAGLKSQSTIHCDILDSKDTHNPSDSQPTGEEDEWRRFSEWVKCQLANQGDEKDTTGNASLDQSAVSSPLQSSSAPQAADLSSSKTADGQLSALESLLHEVLAPLCDSFIRQPPTDLEVRNSGRTRIKETISQVILKACHIETDDDVLQDLRRALIGEAEEMFSNLDRLDESQWRYKYWRTIT